MTSPVGGLRPTLYRWAIRLLTVYLVEGWVMVIALLYGRGAWQGYFRLSFLPVFIPAFIGGLVVNAFYARGFLSQGWWPRIMEWIYFTVFTLAVAAKLVVLVQQ